MSESTCPHCSALLPLRELEEGWCEACGKQIPYWMIAAAHKRTRKRPAVQEDDGPEEPAPRPVAARRVAAPRCALCGEEKSDADVCYLQPTRQSYVPGAFRAQWVNVRCLACEACYDWGRGINRMRHLLAWGMFLLPFLVAGVAVFLHRVLVPAGLPKEAATVITVAGFVLVLVNFVVSPICLIRQTRKRTRAWLGPQIDSELRERLGVPDWGWMNLVKVVREIPLDARFSDLPAAVGSRRGE